MALELEEQTEAVLKTLNAQAKARNIGLAEYLRLFAEAGQIDALGATPSLEEFDTLLEKVSDGLSLFAPLPVDFSRQDIYAGHD